MSCGKFDLTALLVAAATAQLLAIPAQLVGASDDAHIHLNPAAVQQARELIAAHRVVADAHGHWTHDHPSAERANEWIRIHGFGEYGKWHLGIDVRYPEHTKRRYKFPYGDFQNVHRCALLAAQSRAREYRYQEIATAAADLGKLIEKPTTSR